MNARAACLAVFACAGWGASGQSPVDAARGVLVRTVGSSANAFDLHLMDKEGNLDVYEVKARGGRVTVRGSTGVAIARGAYDYMKSACGVQVTWERPTVKLPSRLPSLARKRVVCPNQYRHYFNVCTFGYTMTWWDWKRWQREIDWMALHGINMPLAMNAQEGVWKRVWRSFGVADQDIDSFFSGPAFLPWHRMGNINTHMGPLSDDWHKGQSELQKKILQRERELGMTPVTPAFSGFLPPAFARAHPEAKTYRSSGWAGFEPTVLLSPTDPLFVEIGKRFIQEYSKEFGTDHLYLADVFNEMTPQFSEATKLQDLNNVGKAVYRSIVEGDPQGVWVMQGWLFLNERHFWIPPVAEAFLSAVPDDRMVVIDLGAEIMEVWRAHESVRKKPWIYCTLHNFGQTTPMGGNLPAYAAGPARALNDPGKGRMAGMGITMEGIEQNSAVYELATDAMWQRDPIDVRGWMRRFARQRYGPGSETLEAAWMRLLDTVYTRGAPDAFYTRRPSLDAATEPNENLAEARETLRMFLAAAPKLRTDPVYRRDLVDVAKRYLDLVGRAALYDFVLAQEATEPANLKAAAGHVLKVLRDAERLLSSLPDYRLSKWIDDARRCATTAADRTLFEKNARMQVTLWGGPVLYDYARKEWGGLVESFYIPRWRTFLSGLISGRTADQIWRDNVAFEEEWNERSGLPTSLVEDTVEVAEEIFGRYASVSAPQIDRGIAVGKPATDSGRTEGSSIPARAVDGYSSGGYWAASPYPQWWQVDLGSVRPIARIQVFPYVDGTRYYQYIVSVSSDGTSWTQVVDMSQNTRPSRVRGDVFELSGVRGRYVRVEMLKNSANVGVHLHEVRVFER